MLMLPTFNNFAAHVYAHPSYDGSRLILAGTVTAVWVGEFRNARDDVRISIEAPPHGEPNLSVAIEGPGS